LFNDATAIVTFSIVLATIKWRVECCNNARNAFNFCFLLRWHSGADGWHCPLLRDGLGKAECVGSGTLSAITAYSAFIVADEILHVSGVMAVIGAGIVVGWYKSIGLKPQVRGSQ